MIQPGCKLRSRPTFPRYPIQTPGASTWIQTEHGAHFTRIGPAGARNLYDARITGSPQSSQNQGRDPEWIATAPLSRLWSSTRARHPYRWRRQRQRWPTRRRRPHEDVVRALCSRWRLPVDGFRHARLARLSHASGLARMFSDLDVEIRVRTAPWAAHASRWVVRNEHTSTLRHGPSAYSEGPLVSSDQRTRNGWRSMMLRTYLPGEPARRRSAHSVSETPS